MGTSGSLLPPSVHGFAAMVGNLDLQPTANGAWTDSTLELELPQPGTYHLSASARAVIQPAANSFVVVRLFDVDANTEVPDSDVLVTQRTPTTGGGNASAAIQAEYQTPTATTIRLQARRNGSTNNVAVQSDANGLTTLRFQRVGP